MAPCLKICLYLIPEQLRRLRSHIPLEKEDPADGAHVLLGHASVQPVDGQPEADALVEVDDCLAVLGLRDLLRQGRVHIAADKVFAHLHQLLLKHIPAHRAVNM